ncbi:MAG: TIGR03960 family B12-binding radical SAM protein [Lachnospiraceae bacterium]|nr:TIGR03960 family B12-binding radical SAM protein [Lachnospiraceae bacterium]
MRKLALSDEILMSVQEPARYIGGELNMIVKDKEKVDIRFAMCFPDVYEIGMSHLGIQILYDFLNQREDTYCERVYSPWPDMHKIMKEKDIPLFALETQDKITDFDFLGITLQYEMCYTNILQILDLAKMPFYAADRTDDMPIVIGGGPCTYNPEPISEFFDMFYMGEGEVSYPALLDLYKEMKKAGKSKADFLRAAAKIPGIYVPSLYDVSYNEDGTLKSFTPRFDDVPATVKKQVVTDMTEAPFPEKPLVPFVRAVQDRVVLEVMRGCIRGCRFCQAGMVYRPTRQKNVEKLKKQAKLMLANTGYEEISLSSLSTSDYESLKELIDFLCEECEGKGINISLPSLRIDSFSLDIMKKVQDVKKSSLTFAPEAGSQRMRNVINKGLTEENILTGASTAFAAGWRNVKLYFMLGLPGETEEDIKSIPELANEIAVCYYKVPKDQRNGKCAITISTSFFVPKPFTPFQWAPMVKEQDYLNKAYLVSDTLRELINKKSIKYNYHDADVTVLEGVLARGDRRIAKAIVKAYENESIFDAWSDFFKFEKWLNAFEETGTDVGFYTLRERDIDELFPWDFIDVGVTKEFLKREWFNSKKEVVTPNCRQKCAGCGAAGFGGGVCFENKN